MKTFQVVCVAEFVTTVEAEDVNEARVMAEEEAWAFEDPYWGALLVKESEVDEDGDPVQELEWIVQVKERV